MRLDRAPRRLDGRVILRQHHADENGDRAIHDAPAHATPSAQSRLSDRLPSFVAPVLAVAAVALALATQLAYSADVGVPMRWLGFVVAGVIFAASAYAAGRAPEGAPEVQTLDRRWEIALLAAVLVLATFFRFYRLLEFPPGLWFDEGIIGRDAITMIDRDHLTVWRETNFGRSTLFLYVLIASFKTFGFTLFAMRVVPAVCGLAAVVAFYFLARWLSGPVPALIATALLAVSRWAVTFSRITWEASIMPLLEIMAVYFFVRALETRRPLYFFLAGGSLAAGIYTYVAFRLMPFLMIFLLLYVLVTQWRLIRDNVAGLAVYALSFIVVIIPLGQYVVQHQDQFLERTRAVNVFREVEDKDSWEPLKNNIRASVEMMNVRGDNNGRHNLPDAPMLDDITAALFVLGIAISLYSFRNWRRGHIVPWYVLMLVPGATTISVENPSAIRDIGALPPIFLLVGLAMATLYRSLATVRYGVYAFGAMSIALVGISVGVNYHDTFEVQANDKRVYEAFTPVYTRAGEVVAKRADKDRVFVSRDYHGHPALEVLANKKLYTRYTATRDLIFPDGERDVLLVADSLQFGMLPTLQRLYPGLERDDYTDPFGRVPFTRVRIPAGDVTALHELPLQATRAGVAIDVPARSRIDREWTDEDTASGPIDAVWRGYFWSSIYPGDLGFELTAPGVIAIEIDGRRYESGTSTLAALATLAPGEHEIAVFAQITSAGAVAGRVQGTDVKLSDFLYATSVGERGFRVLYREGTEFSVAPGTTIGQVPFAAPVDVYGVWRGIEYQGVYETTTAGTFGFALDGSNAVQLFVDDQLVVDNGGSHGQLRVEGTVELSPGAHTVAIQYTFLDRPNWALSVRPPDGEWTAMTGEEFTVPTGAYAPPALATFRLDTDWAGSRGLEGIGKLTAAAVSPDGSIVAADRDSMAFVSAEGIVTRTIDPGLADIIDLDVGPGGEIYVLDRESKTLLILNADGTERRRVTNAFDSARGVGAYDGGAYVASPAGGFLYKVPLDGAPEKLAMVTSDAKATQPSDIAAGAGDLIYVADFEKRRIVVSEDGGSTVARAFAGVGGTGEQLPHLDAGDRLIFVTDAVNQRVVAYDRQGKPRGAYVFAVAGRGVRPVAISSVGDSVVYVTDLEQGILYRLTVDIPPATAAALP